MAERKVTKYKRIYWRINVFTIDKVKVGDFLFNNRKDYQAFINLLMLDTRWQFKVEELLLEDERERYVC